MKTSEWIRETRKKNGVSQRELAKRIDVAVNTVSGWERGRCEPTLANLAAIKQALLQGPSNPKRVAKNIPDEINGLVIPVEDGSHIIIISYKDGDQIVRNSLLPVDVCGTDIKKISKADADNVLAMVNGWTTAFKRNILPKNISDGILLMLKKMLQRPEPEAV